MSVLARSARGPVSAAAAAAKSRVRGDDVFRDENDVVLEFPFRGAGGLLVVGGDAVFHEGGLPLVGDDQRPEEEEALVGIEEEDGVGFGEARSVGEGEGGGPFAGEVIPAGGLDEDVVRGALAGAVEPADEEVSVGEFDYGGGVVVPLFEGEDELAGILWGGLGAGDG